MTIKLGKNGDYTFISEPSGKKVGKKDLVVGGIYIHNKLYNYRKITSIRGIDIYWEDCFGSGVCNTNVFLNTCKYELTEEEKDFIDKKLD